MKPAPFKYFAPTSQEEALALLAEYGDEAKLLAGGQSLVPTMNFRMAQPAILIDLNRVGELFYISAEDSGGLRMGAMTRQRQVERNDLTARHAPLLHQTMPYIAHPQIRNRGTIGGSLAHADPAAELPAVMVALQATFRLRKQGGEREVPAEAFFQDLFMTALEPDEMLAEVIVPALPDRTGCAFREIARRHGDYALVGVAAIVTLTDEGKCEQARLALLSVGSGPVLAEQAVQILIGNNLTRKLLQEAAAIAAHQDIDPPADIHASSAFRRHLAQVLTEDALSLAWERAQRT